MKKITQSESMWLWVFGKLLQHFFFFFLKRKHISLKLTRRVIQRACEAGQRKQFTAQIRMQKRHHHQPSEHSTTRPDLINLEWVTVRPYLLGEDTDPWRGKSINPVELDLCWPWRVKLLIDVSQFKPLIYFKQIWSLNWTLSISNRNGEDPYPSFPYSKAANIFWSVLLCFAFDISEAPLFSLLAPSHNQTNIYFSLIVLFTILLSALPPSLTQRSISLSLSVCMYLCCYWNC